MVIYKIYYRNNNGDFPSSLSYVEACESMWARDLFFYTKLIF